MRSCAPPSKLRSPPGGELPAERVLASELGVSRTTVVAGYANCASAASTRLRGTAAERRCGTPCRPHPAHPRRPWSGCSRARTLPRRLINLSVGAPEFDEVVEGLHRLRPGSATERTSGHGYVAARLAGASCGGRRATIAAWDAYHPGRGADQQPARRRRSASQDGLAASGWSSHRSRGARVPGGSTRSARAGGQPLAVERDAAGLRVDRAQAPARATAHTRPLPRADMKQPERHPDRTPPARAACHAGRRARADPDRGLALDELRFDGDPGTPMWRTSPSACWRRARSARSRGVALRVGGCGRRDR